MKTRVDIESFEKLSALSTKWRKDAAPGETSLDVKGLLATHLAQHDAVLRNRAAVAALVTVSLIGEVAENLSEELAGRVKLEAVAWVTSLCGSAPLQVRMRMQRGDAGDRSTTPPDQRGTGKPARAIVEMVVAPVRPERHGSGSVRNVVSVNKALVEVARATLGSGHDTRHAHALNLSWRRHLQALPPEQLGMRVNDPPPSHRALVLDVEDLRVRTEELAQANAELERREGEVLAFPQHAQEILELLQRQIAATQAGQGVTKQGHTMSEGAKALYRRHSPAFGKIKDNPDLAPGARILLGITLEELRPICSESASGSTTSQGAPQVGVEAATERTATGAITPRAEQPATLVEASAGEHLTRADPAATEAPAFDFAPGPAVVDPRQPPVSLFAENDDVAPEPAALRRQQGV